MGFFGGLKKVAKVAVSPLTAAPIFAAKEIFGRKGGRPRPEGRIGGEISYGDAEREMQETERILREQATALQEKRNKKLEELRAAENELRGQLSTTTKDVGTAVDRELEGLLAQTGFQAGVARQAVGEAGETRGLGRSSMLAEQIGDITSEEFGQRAELQQGAASAKRQIMEKSQEPIRQIQAQREAIELGQYGQEIMSNKSLANVADRERLQLEYNEIIRGIGRTSQRNAFLSGMAGGISKSFGEIFAGQAGSYFNKPRAQNLSGDVRGIDVSPQLQGKFGGYA